MSMVSIKKWLLPIIIGAFFVAGSSIARSQQVPSPTSSGELMRISARIAGDSGGGELNLEFVVIPIRSDLSRRIRIVSAAESYVQTDETGVPDGRSLRQFHEGTRARFSISGGLLRSSDPVAALGFVRVLRQVRNLPRTDSPVEMQRLRGFLLDAAFCVSEDGRAVVLNAIEWDRADWLRYTLEYPSCLQVGPIFNFEGRVSGRPQEFGEGTQNPDRTTFWSSRHTAVTFVCTRQDGTLVLGIVFRSAERPDVAMEEVAASTLAPRIGISDGPRCAIAARLSSGRWAGLIVGNELRGFSDFRLPNAIVLLQ